MVGCGDDNYRRADRIESVFWVDSFSDESNDHYPEVFLIFTSVTMSLAFCQVVSTILSYIPVFVPSYDCLIRRPLKFDPIPYAIYNIMKCQIDIMDSGG